MTPQTPIDHVKVPNPCFDGVSSCSNGTSQCVNASAKAAGQSCGTNMVCASTGGNCVACTANQACTTNPNPCFDGVSSCSSGTLQCVNTTQKPPGAWCGGNATCTNGTLLPRPVCSASAVCVSGTATSCNGFACNGVACFTSCSNDTQCMGTHYCNGTTCQPKAINGVACLTANQCGSGICADSVCCNAACSGTCSACNVAGSAGTCTNHSAGNDPENGCGLYQCNGAGACYSGCSSPVCPSTTCKAAAFCSPMTSTCVGDLGMASECTLACECASGSCNVYYRDVDNDGSGAGAASRFCATSAPSGYSAVNTDCNDANPAILPGATEVVGDEVDQNCDGQEICFRDNDNDGYRMTSTITSADIDCRDPQEAWGALPTGDCCDSDSRAKPGQTSYFTTPTSGCTGGGGFDFDCNGTSLRRDLASGGCEVDGACGDNAMSCTGPGWAADSSAACGVSAAYRNCTSVSACNPNTCRGCEACGNITTATRTQACR